MNNLSAIWLTAFRTDYLNSTPEHQEFVRANVVRVAQTSPIYVDQRNNNKLKGYVIGDHPNRLTPAEMTKVAGHLAVKIAPSATAIAEVTPIHGTLPYLTFLSNIKEYKLGEKIYKTQLDPEFIRYLGDILDMSEILPKTIGCDQHVEAFGYKSQTNTELIKDVFSKHSAWVDSVGTIAIFPEDLVDAFKKKFDDATLQVTGLKTASLFKGTAPYVSPDKLTIAQLASGGRFFLYSTEIAVENEATATVPFIGLGIFGDDKFLRYKNALSLLQHLQAFTTNIGTQQNLYPEKYKELIRQQGSSVTAFWPALTTLLGKGEKGFESKTLKCVDATAIKREDPNKFKAFLINTVLQKTPEASRYLAIKSKHEQLEKTSRELAAEVAANEAARKLAEEEVLAAIEEMSRLQGKIKLDKCKMVTASELVLKTQPQALRTANAVIEVMSQMGPLEKEYNDATTKYWDQDVDLDLLTNWEKQGFLITKLVVRDGVANRDLTTAEQIRERLTQVNLKNVYISQIEVTTTAPTIIYEDGHLHQADLSKATKHVGGPYRCLITSEGHGDAQMKVYLVDDRAFRANYANGGYRRHVVHPHVSAQSLCTETDWKSNPAGQWARSTTVTGSACMGEFQPIAYKGMHDLSLSTILYGLKGWLQQADTRDGYGLEVKHFPLAKDVIVETFGPPVIKSNIDLTKIEPVYSKQQTYTKIVDSKHLATIFLMEENKLVTMTAEATPANEKLIFVSKAENTLMFFNTTQRDAYLAAAREELTKEGYSLYAEAKSIAKIGLEFPYVAPTTGTTTTNAPVLNTTGSEPYRPVRRVTAEIINELQNVINQTARA